MASYGDIERWITVHGVHIPIFKGESKMKAVSRFIEGRRDKKIKDRKDYEKRVLATPGYEQDDEGIERDIRHEMIDQRKPIKGYSTDPYNRVNKAIKARKDTNAAYEKAIRELEKDRDAFRDSEQKRLKEYKNKLDEKYKDRLKSDVIYNKYYNDFEREDRRADYNYEVKQSKIQNMRRMQDWDAAENYGKELYKKYKGYTLSSKKHSAIKPGDVYENANGAIIRIDTPTKKGEPQVQFLDKKTGKPTDIRKFGNNENDLARLLDAYGYKKKKR